MSFAGSSPRWRAFEAQVLPPVVLPSLSLIHSAVEPKIPDKVALCERFCAEKHHFLEIQLIRARLHIRALEAPPEPEPYRWTSKEIIRLVAEKHGLTPHDLLCDGRITPLVVARHEAFYEIARLTDLSLMQIGRAFGRDHTTARSGIMRHTERSGLPPVRGLVPPPKVGGMPYVPAVPKWPPARRAKAIELVDSGLSYSAAAKVMGTTKGCISSVILRCRAVAAKSTAAE